VPNRDPDCLGSSGEHNDPTDKLSTARTFMKRLLAIFLVASVAPAYAIPTYVNPLGENSSSSSLSLQGVIDARGNSLVDINSAADQLDTGIAGNLTWTAIGTLQADLVIELAGFAPNNAFGIYNKADSSEKTVLFPGGASAGVTASVIAPYATFGFFLTNSVAGFTWYSDPSLNAGGGLSHLVAYQGKGELLNLGDNPLSPVGSTLWDANSYLLGWEDMNPGDQDFNDMIAVVRDVRLTSVPLTVPDGVPTWLLLVIAVPALLFRRNKLRRAVQTI
jgi:hypothetical protein